MTPRSDSLSWQPLDVLYRQFEQNLLALATRDAALASRLAALMPPARHFIATDGHRLHIAAESGVRPAGANGSEAQIEPIADRVPPDSARQIAAKLFPAGKCTEPVLVAGLDRGWLWNALYELPTHTPHAPGHTPPLYFLARDLNRLHTVLHLHDWRKLLADPRVRLFAGNDCVIQAQLSMANHLHLPMPRLCVTVDPATWPPGASIDTITAHALGVANVRARQLAARLDSSYARFDPASVFTLDHHQPLRILGITSRFTTFLQYSMRDWLDAFESLGHETHLLIEPDDASQMNPIDFAETCAAFRPELIVMIDHYRGEFSGVPANVPWVMWIQDQLPNMFRPKAGAAQTRFDYTIGYGRNACVYEHGYPSSRFLPAMIGTNERRFHPRRLTADEYARHGCDVSFVSHASTPAEVLLAEEIARQSSPDTRRVFEAIFAKLKSRYDAGGAVTIAADLRAMIDEALVEQRVRVDNVGGLMDIFTNRINNALFRHQALQWLAELHESDGVRIHLYGRGWEKHPAFAPLARGVADNETELSAIYQASKINLQVTPWGAAHQRVFDGTAAGGFFLFRGTEVERCDRVYRELWRWCDANDVRSDRDLKRAAELDAMVRSWIEQITRLNGVSPFAHGFDFVNELFIVGSRGFTRSAATLWEEYDQVVFDTRQQLHDRVRRFLHDDAARAVIARGMRERTIECMTYRAVAKQTLDFIARDIATGVASEDVAMAA